MQGKHFGFAVGILLCCGASVQAQYAPTLPGNGLPKVQYFHRYDSAGESVQLDDVHETVVPVIVEETGRVPQSDTRQIIERRTYRVADLRALSLQGEELKLADVLGKLKTDDPVIVIARGQKLPAGYDKILRDDVVILQIPTPARISVRQAPGYGYPSRDTRPADSAPTEERPRLESQPVFPYYVAPPTVPVAPQRNAPSGGSYQPVQPTPPAPPKGAPIQPARVSPDGSYSSG
jgi:hypothetical protein